MNTLYSIIELAKLIIIECFINISSNVSNTTHFNVPIRNGFTAMEVLIPKLSYN